MEHVRRWAATQKTLNRPQRNSLAGSRRASTGGAIRSLNVSNQWPAAAALAMTEESFYCNGTSVDDRRLIILYTYRSMQLTYHI